MRLSALLGIGLSVLAAQASAEPAAVAPITVTIGPAGNEAPRFDPRSALGAGVDGAAAGEADRLLTPGNIAAMRAAGLTALTYRLRTELGIEVWHWNPAGRWSDRAHAQGYWTSSDRLGAPIALSYGYRLPRRGDTVDNADDTDYSRLTDGDEATYWKSNPYLDPRHLRDGQAHTQWLVVRLDEPAAIDAVRIAWADPYAVDYEVQYWTGDGEYTKGARWVTFPQGRIAGASGGTVTLRLADRPVVTRFVRVLLGRGSYTALPGVRDWRDRAGFAVREIGAGRLAADGALVDVLRHAPARDEQSFTHVSSTDPWHRASDRDAKLEQPGIDRVFASGLGNGQPVLMPVGVLYDTPGNAAAELRYLRRRHYPVRQVEIGEEPDGQYIAGEDYGALYLALVRRLEQADPGVTFGGPSAQDAFTGTWMDSDPDRSWNSHFIRYLRARGALGALGFYSFEHYPFDDICGDISAKLIEQNHQMDALFTRLAGEGVPRTIPWIIAEYGFSAFSGRAMAQMPSALLMANIVGQFLDKGGSAAYLYGYGPNVPINQHQPCAGYGNMMLHMADAAGQAREPMPSFYTARLITDGWLMPRGRHTMLPSTVAGASGEWVASYAVRRPDGRTAVLLINRNPADAYSASLQMRDTRGRRGPLTGPGLLLQYGPAQYAWQDSGAASRPLRSEPPTEAPLPPGAAVVSLPPESLTVVVR